MDMPQRILAIRKHSGMTPRQIVQAGEHGADTGWPGFTYTADCCEFFDAHAEDIWEQLDNMAENLGSKNVAELIAGFGRTDMAYCWDGFRNLLAWFALEEAGHWLANIIAEAQGE